MRWMLVVLTLACGGSTLEPRSALEWAATPLDAWLPHRDCPFGGTSRAACHRGCTITATVTGTYEEVRIQRRSHDRAFHLTVRADGTLTARASVTRRGRRLDAALYLAPDVEPTDTSLEGRSLEDAIDATPTPRWSATPERAAEVWTEVFGWLHQRDLPRGIDRRAHRTRVYEWREGDVETRRTDRFVGRRGASEELTLRDGLWFARSLPPTGHTPSEPRRVEAEPWPPLTEPTTPTLTRDGQGHVVGLVEDGEEVARVTRDSAGRVIEVRAGAYVLAAERDPAGRVVVETAERAREGTRRLEHTYEGERLVRSRWTDGENDELVRLSYAGACGDVTPSLPPDHDPEVDSPVAWW